MPVAPEWDDRRLQIRRLIRESQARRVRYRVERAARETAGTRDVESPDANQVLLEAILATVTRIEARLADR
ncbi:MAG: hypothetical protein F4Y54_03505 [Dehalococcoidia bacterium]|nr:hypothetical protein [Dehalococcoidia bacterium]